MSERTSTTRTPKKRRVRNNDPVHVTPGNRVVWYPSGVVGLGPRPQKRFKSKADAEAYAVELRAAIGEGVRTERTFGDLIDDYLEVHNESAPEGTLRRYRSTLNNWVIPHIDDIALTSFGMEHFVTCLKAANSAGTGPTVIGGIDTAIGAVIGHGIESEWFGNREPLPKTLRSRTVKKYRKLAERRAHTTKRQKGEPQYTIDIVPTLDSIRQVAAAYGRRVDGGEDAVMFITGSGARWCEFVGLETDRLRIDTHEVEFLVQADRYAPWGKLAELKDWEQRTVPVWPEAHEAMERLHARAGDGRWIFGPPCGYKFDWVAKSARELANAMTACAWPPRQRAHYLRHHFATYSLAPTPKGYGQDLATVSHLLGHVTPDYTARMYVKQTSTDITWNR